MTAKKNKKKFNPVSIFVTSTSATKFWFTLAAIFGCICIFQPYLIIYAYRVDEKILLLDQSGTFHVSPSVAFEAANSLHDYMGRLAIKALIERGPKGAKNPVLLKQVFLPRSYKYAINIMNQEAKVFKERKITQTLENVNIKIWKGKNHAITEEALGEFKRTGDFHGQEFHEYFKFKIILYFGKNPDMRENTRLPLAVKTFSYRTKEKK